MKNVSVTIVANQYVAPVSIPNSEEIIRVCVIVPDGITGRVSLREVNNAEPFYNETLDANHLHKENKFVQVSAKTDIEGFIEIDQEKGATATINYIVCK